MHILFATLEVAPFSKVGGLGDVAKALPETLHDMGVEVTIITPWYSGLPLKDPRFQSMETLRRGWLPLGQTLLPFSLLTERDPPPGPRMVFVDEPVYLSRHVPYSPGGQAMDAIQDPQGSILFSKAVVDYLVHNPHDSWVVHLNEHQTAPVAALLNLLPSPPPSLLTVHNFGHHGVWDGSVIHLLGLPSEGFFPGGPLEFYGKVNFLKLGLWYASAISTVSETYMREAMTDPMFGLGMEGVLQSRPERVAAILNGIDTQTWNPAKNPHLGHGYSAAKLQNKALIKADLLRELEMDETLAEKPVCGVISRLVDQKGVDLLLGVADRLLAGGAGLVVLGSGAPHYERGLKQLEARHPRRCRVNLDYNEPLSHRIEAGADMFLMPSRFEPCGLNQMYSLAYGTVPVVRHTGGLADTVVDVTLHPAKGNGFSFVEPAPDAFWDAITRALALFEDRDKWSALMRRGMRQDHSWTKSAEKYIKLYTALDNRLWPPQPKSLPPPSMALDSKPPAANPLAARQTVAKPLAAKKPAAKPKAGPGKPQPK
ncbi:MAG: glycogen synthase [Deltaproteobacteria bacterium]|nr:glycogen synthase [Deltaproteobacteria bacterium]